MKPDSSEYPSYYETYVGKVADRPIIEVLTEQRDATQALLSSIDSERETYRYADGKWTVREAVGHMLDTERVMGYRALHIARGGDGAIPGMDQDMFARHAPYATRPLASIADEFFHLRSANIAQFDAWDDSALARNGIASDVRFTVRGLLYIIAGHELHHVGILKMRYLQMV